MDSLRDRVNPVTRRSNASECDVTFDRYCNYSQVEQRTLWHCFHNHAVDYSALVKYHITLVITGENLSIMFHQSKADPFWHGILLKRLHAH